MFQLTLLVDDEHLPMLRDQIIAEHAAAQASRPRLVDIVREALRSGPKRGVELRRLGEAAGHNSKSSVYVTLNWLISKGEVERPELGLYRIKEDASPPSPLGTQKQRMLAALASGPKTRSELTEAVGSSTPVDGRVNELMHEGKIERVGKATYQLKEST